MREFVLAVPYTLWLSWRYLTARRREAMISVHSLFAVFGVAVGVAALITVIAVMTGFDRDLRDKVMGLNAHLVVEYPGGVDDAAGLMSRIERLEEVRDVSPYVTGQAILKAARQTTGIVFRGVDAGREARAGGVVRYLTEGDAQFGGGDGVWVGVELARALGLTVGSACRLISPADGKERPLEVTGIFDSGMYEYDATLAFVSIPKAREVLRLEAEATGLSVWLRTPHAVDTVKARLQEDLGPFYWVRSWFDLNQNLFSAIRIEKIVMFVILTLIIFVAAFNIASSLTMTVMEKTGEIGVLRAMGATAGQIYIVFLLQGLWIGGLGLAAGVGGGVALTLNLNPLARALERVSGIEIFPENIYYFDRIPAVIRPDDVLWVAGCALAVTVLASLYPARHAARLEPAEALRYD